MPADVLVDIGHSRIKWARACDGRLDQSSLGRAATDDSDALRAALSAWGSNRAIMSGQSRPETVARIARCLRQDGVDVDIISTGDRALPVEPAYPELGCDRWLALQHAWVQSRSPLAVVDCGTAVTVDVVAGDGIHQGGWIMAGMGSARDGLLARAPGLKRPLSPPGEVERPAGDTAQALARGNILLAVGGIERALRAAERTINQPLDIWLTGGDAADLAEHFERTLRHDPHLVLHGLAMATQAK